VPTAVRCHSAEYPRSTPRYSAVRSQPGDAVRSAGLSARRLLDAVGSAGNLLTLMKVSTDKYVRLVAGVGHSRPAVMPCRRDTKACKRAQCRHTQSSALSAVTSKLVGQWRGVPCPTRLRPFSSVPPRHRVRSAPCPFGIVSLRHRAPSAPCPFGIVPLRHRAPSAPCPFGTVPLRHRAPSAPCPFGTVPLRHRPRGSICISHRRVGGSLGGAA
jgi:hypothetical protein